MTHILLQVLILVVVVGGLLYILNVLPIDNTIKVIGRVIVIIVAAVYAIGLIAPMVNAQPAADRPVMAQRDWDRDHRDHDRGDYRRRRGPPVIIPFPIPIPGQGRWGGYGYDRYYGTLAGRMQSLADYGNRTGSRCWLSRDYDTIQLTCELRD